MHVENKVAIITGGSSGFGKALAYRLVNKGAKVILADIDVKGGEQVAAELNAGKPIKVAHFVRCDVTSPSDLSALFPLARSQFGRFDILVNNSGIMEPAHLFVDESQIWRKVLDINLTAVVEGTRLGVEAFQVEKQQGRLGSEGGVIVNTASIAGILPFTLGPVYTATKHGVVGFTRCFKKDLITKNGPRLEEKRSPTGHALFDVVHEMGVRVNAVAPTWADTGLIKDIREMALGMHITVPVEQVIDGFMKVIEDQSCNGDIAVVRPNMGVHIVRSMDLADLAKL
ncbi:hypothetical protein BG011_001255 [Mortierella polycephala]|uniref:Uncharacterized protein n=1 Tax=Mortierella polycephala TaxID=41804 RepID=A0A9P6Q6V1_9FUNG|nr:hypothetical protein BG011_001255 [Mortierella polycephala]